MDEVMSGMRRDELEFYKLYIKDEAFRTSLDRTMERLDDDPELI